MEKVRPWCGQPLDRVWLKTEPNITMQFIVNCMFSDSNVSKSSVAKYATCGESFSNHFFP